jgi:hypothetical protein
MVVSFMGDLCYWQIIVVQFLPKEQRSTAGTWLNLATQDYIMFKIGCTWVTQEAWGPLGAQLIPIYPNQTWR